MGREVSMNPSSVCCDLERMDCGYLCKKGRSRIDYFVLEWFSVAMTMNYRGVYITTNSLSGRVSGQFYIPE